VPLTRVPLQDQHHPLRQAVSCIDIIWALDLLFANLKNADDTLEQLLLPALSQVVILLDSQDEGDPVNE
jgi:hypothetical protein